MRIGTVFGLLLGLWLVGVAQVREVWRYMYTPDEPDLLARLERVVRLQDGSLLLLGWTETSLNGQDALAIRLQPNGTAAWVFQRDGARLDDAFVDALEVRDGQGEALILLGRFTDADGYLQTRLVRLNPDGQMLQEQILPRNPQTHLRPLRLTPRDDGNLDAILAERIANGQSKLTIYRGPHVWDYALRPWGTVLGTSAPLGDVPAFVLGTNATLLNGLDAQIEEVVFGGSYRYGGPARGFDIPLLGTLLGDWTSPDDGFLVVIQSEGGYTGEDIVVMRFRPVLQFYWGYRYTTAQHDDFPETLAVDAAGNAYLLARTHFWSGEPFEQRTLRVLKFSPQGSLQENALLDIGRSPFDLSPLTGIVRVNSAGQRFIAAHLPPYLARLSENGQPLWIRTPSMRFQELFTESDGSLIAAGEWMIFNQSGRLEDLKLAVIKYAPDGDVDGNGCVDDADLLRVLFVFGQSGASLLEDMNGDGVVDDADLLQVLFHFGSGC